MFIFKHVWRKRWEIRQQGRPDSNYLMSIDIGSGFHSEASRPSGQVMAQQFFLP